VFTNYGFSDEVLKHLKKTFVDKKFFCEIWVSKDANTTEENLCYWSKRVVVIDQFGMCIVMLWRSVKKKCVFH
jgi:hypothetical protein